MRGAVKAEDSGRQYKTFKNLEADLEPPEFKHKPGRTIHLWLGNSALTSVSAHRNPDGSYSGTLALKNGGVYLLFALHGHAVPLCCAVLCCPAFCRAFFIQFIALPRWLFSVVLKFNKVAYACSVLFPRGLCMLLVPAWWLLVVAVLRTRARSFCHDRGMAVLSSEHAMFVQRPERILPPAKFACHLHEMQLHWYGEGCTGLASLPWLVAED